MRHRLILASACATVVMAMGAPATGSVPSAPTSVDVSWDAPPPVLPLAPVASIRLGDEAPSTVIDAVATESGFAIVATVIGPTGSGTSRLSAVSADGSVSEAVDLPGRLIGLTAGPGSELFGLLATAEGMTTIATVGTQPVPTGEVLSSTPLADPGRWIEPGRGLFAITASGLADASLPADLSLAAEPLVPVVPEAAGSAPGWGELPAHPLRITAHPSDLGPTNADGTSPAVDPVGEYWAALAAAETTVVIHPDETPSDVAPTSLHLVRHPDYAPPYAGEYPPMRSSSGAAVWPTWLDAGVEPGVSDPSVPVIAVVRTDGSGSWYSLADGWTFAASDVYGTVFTRLVGDSVELAVLPGWAYTSEIPPVNETSTTAAAAPIPTTSLAAATTVVPPTTLAPISGPPTTVASRACASYEDSDGSYPIRRCHSGTYVWYVQGLLGLAGYSVETDSHFGPGTEEAVIAFQRANGLTADGLVGPQTWSALAAEVSADIGFTDSDGNGRIDPWEFAWD